MSPLGKTIITCLFVASILLNISQRVQVARIQEQWEWERAYYEDCANDALLTSIMTGP